MNVAKIGPRLAVLGLLCVLAGCATRPTLDELEQEASKTGDWSKVERREARDKASLETTAPDCPEHLMKLCVKQGLHMTCSCVPRSGTGEP